MASYTAFKVGSECFDCHKAPEDGKPHLAKKFVRRGYHVSWVTSEGKFFSTRVGPGKWFVGSLQGARLDIVRDAVALGVISKKADVALLKVEEARRAKLKVAEAARDVLNSHAAAGLTLTATQLKALKRKAKSPRS